VVLDGEIEMTVGGVKNVFKWHIPT
jgi:hypothetical protein